MKGMLVGVPRQDLPPTAENEFYWADLIGLSVINTQDEHLGYVLGLIESAAHAVLRVGHKEAHGDEISGKSERLLPFVSKIVLDVNVSKRVVRVDWGSDW
jgi:16S rRNA processing protein RimM